MVAYTPGGLPYQTGSDAPCDAPEVWCDFAALLDARLATLRDGYGRIVPAVPAARVSRSTALTIAGPTLLTWEAVDFDNDGMFDTAFSNAALRPTRVGAYMVVADIPHLVVTVGASSSTSELSVTDSSVSISSSGSSGLGNGDDQSLIALTEYGFRVAEVFGWEATSTVGFSAVFSPTTGQTVRIDSASLSVYWVGDGVPT